MELLTATKNEISTELSFTPDLNLLMIKGNPFEMEDFTAYYQVLRKTRMHLNSGMHLNVYIRLNGLNALGQIFFRKLGKLLRKHSGSNSKVMWSVLDGSDQLQSLGLETLDLPQEKVQIVSI